MEKFIMQISKRSLTCKKQVKFYFILALSCFLLFSSLAPANAGTLYNYPYLYKGIRSLGMGGAFTAVGKDAEALFYNPAGLYDMGFQLALINPLIEVDQNIQSLANDAQTAMKKDSEAARMDAITDLISKNMGKPLHARVSLFPHVAVKNFAVGVVGQGSVDARLHNPLSSQGAVEVSAGYEYGPVAGFSIKPPLTGLRVGGGAKYISNSWYEKSITVVDIAGEKIDPTKDMVSKSDLSLDIGLLYDLPDTPFINVLKPKLGLSVLDITDLDFQKNGVGKKIPMRANLGISINPSIPILADTVIALDYQDITGAYKQDKSIWKRVHIGGEAGFLSRRILVRAGLNQGYPSFGAELNVLIFKLGYAYYTEEMAAYAGQDKDTRQVIHLGIGW
jgi:hypothetical protein